MLTIITSPARVVNVLPGNFISALYSHSICMLSNNYFVIVFTYASSEKHILHLYLALHAHGTKKCLINRKKFIQGCIIVLTVAAAHKLTMRRQFILEYLSMEAT